MFVSFLVDVCVLYLLLANRSGACGRACRRGCEQEQSLRNGLICWWWCSSAWPNAKAGTKSWLCSSWLGLDVFMALHTARPVISEDNSLQVNG